MKHTDFPPIIDCRDEQKIIEFLKIIDNTLPVPLSARTVPSSFATLSSVRTEVVPTAITRQPSFFAALMMSADS